MGYPSIGLRTSRAQAAYWSSDFRRRIGLDPGSYGGFICPSLPYVWAFLARPPAGPAASVPVCCHLRVPLQTAFVRS